MRSIHHSLIFRLILLVGVVQFVSVFTWTYFDIKYQKRDALEGIAREVDRLSNTIALGAHYAMMLNSRDDINEIIKNIGRQEGIQDIRIYNKQGRIKFSNSPSEVDTTTNIKAEACVICHRSDPPLDAVELKNRVRIFNSPEGTRLLGIISPIYNEPGCSADACHVHPAGKKVLGALDVVVSLKNTDSAISSYERWAIVIACLGFLGVSGIVAAFLMVFVNRPIKKLITWTRLIGQGKYDRNAAASSDDEIGQLADAIDQMGKEIGEKQEELNRQRNEYQELFEMVPCYITVQDRNLRLLRYNREFIDHFGPSPGDYCFAVYKGRSEPCGRCPVLMTFEDGESHTSEETGVAKDGSTTHWIVRTSAVRDSRGGITAVMETSLDATPMKRLEEEISKSEEKYRDIFNNIPNPVFVLDRKSLTILDCNESVRTVYGHAKDQLLRTSFLNFFDDAEQQQYALEIRTSEYLNGARQLTKGGNAIYVSIRVSPSEYMGRPALLVTTADITKRLLAEQQLIQASKMATLGEMATGIAHELNQPLSVIKTASSFLKRKVERAEPIRDDILKTMTEEIDNHVDRASKIINHLREFGRKSEVRKERIDVNVPLEKALDIFSQQLKLREIEVVKDLEEGLPRIMADSNRLEQVFINLLINARDAIEEKGEKNGEVNTAKQIYLGTSIGENNVQVVVKDTGTGVPKPLLDKIFEPFFTTKRVGKGTGLGLSISYGIVQDYDGTIRVETTEGEGSAFIIRFPVASED
jgi:histidine kinase